MSLGRLLVAGKSLVGMRDGAGRYQVNKYVALPKFISPRNPFAATAKPEAPPLGAEMSAKDRKEKAVVATANSDPGAVGKKDFQVAMGVRAARWISEWGEKLNPLPRLAKRPRPVKLAVPRLTKAPVQSELSLDKIQVVRNDLSDADFEVVPAKTPVAVSPGPTALASQARFEPAGSPWNRVTTRIFGVGQT
ncbi:MAG: hypothetical protein MUF81_07645 [Verrucomicrobia bacterium]|nr:hypothetical protein [Verrucomicrobiota bacterium]